MIFDIDGIESKIEYSFKDKMLLRKCFTHRSYGHEHGEDDYDLLEFFGDSIIQMAVTEFLVSKVPGDSGTLTKKRQEIVSAEPLRRVVKSLGLDNFVLLGQGQCKSSAHSEKLFSDVYESLVAGIYIDGGVKPAKDFIKRTIIADFIDREKNRQKSTVKTDYKSALQELVQKKKLGSVSYETLSKTGPDHLPEYRAAVLLNNGRLAEGKGCSIKAAQNSAAGSALKKLERL